MSALIRMVEMPDIKAVLDELRNMKSTSIGNLLAFMHTFNLRFGPAETPKQRMIYEKLYPEVDQLRDRILDEIKPTSKAEARNDNGQFHDFFSGVAPEHLDRKKADDTPAAPEPNAPK
jgi:hypothetical protein